MKTFLQVLVQSDSKIRIRSNVSPEMVFNLSQMIAQSGAYRRLGEYDGAIFSTERDLETSVVSGNPILMRVARPKIALKGLGLTTSSWIESAPYGEPYKHGWLIAIGALVLSVLLGIKLAWMFCGWVPPKELSKLKTGETLEITASDPGSVKDISSFCSQTGHELVLSQSKEGLFIFVIRKSN